MFPNLTGNLSSILSMVPAPDKMTIIPLKKSSPVPIPAGAPYIIQFNPENYDEANKVMFNKEQPIGSVGRHQHFEKVEPRAFTFNFLIDGTGASGGDKREVITEIELFKKTVEFKGDQHRTSFLLLIWGSYVATAVLKELKIKYSLFRKNGTPLRAELNTTFSEHKERLLQLLEQGLMSPDLSSRHIVKADDKLPLMCYGVYDTPRHYLEVARANGLINFRYLETGHTLDFPPVKKQ